MTTALPPIKEPNVLIFQQLARSVAEVPAVALTPCVVAPNYQVVKAQDNDGNLNPDALVGSYQNLDQTITYALPGVEDGAQLDADSVKLYLLVGTDLIELDEPAGEEIIISSTGTVVNGTPHTLTDSVQDFVSSGVLGGEDIEDNDYVARLLGADAITRDFPISVVATTVLSLLDDENGDVAPSAGSEDYEVIRNPTKFIVNASALKASLRVDIQTATLSYGAADGEIVYASVLGGNEGNALSVTHANDGTGAPTFTLDGQHLTVHLDVGGSNAPNDIIAAIAGNAAVAALFSASATGTGADPTSLVEAETSLAGGAHLVFQAPTAGVAGNSKRLVFALASVDQDPLSFDIAGQDMTINLANDTSSPDTTAKQLVDALTSSGDPAYDAAADAFIDVTGYYDTAGQSELIALADLNALTALSGGFEANSVTVDADLLSNDSVSVNLYASYRALRLVYTASASVETTGNSPVLASAVTQDEIEERVGEISHENPLALMMYLSHLNNQGRLIYGLGVDDVSTSEPDGTTEAWSRAADLMTNQSPYFTAVASQRNAVHDIWIGHQQTMNGDASTPARLERWLFLNKSIPLQEPDVVLAQGTGNGDSSGTTFTAPHNFTLAGVVTGDVLVLDNGDEATGADVILQDGTEGFEVDSVGGGGFQLTTNATLPTLSDVDWDVYREGELLQVAGVWDKLKTAETINIINQQIGNRKIASTFPDNCVIEIDGEDVSLPGYYLDAALTGLCAAQSVARSKTRQPVRGIKAVRFSNDFFSADQLDIIQGGGTWTMHQPSANGSVLTRFALSTDVSSPEAKNPTATWQVDKYSRLARAIVKSTLAGALTLELLDDIAGKLDMLGKFVKDQKELAARPLISALRQGDGSEAPVDEVIIEGSASPLQPNNGIRFYLTISST